MNMLAGLQIIDGSLGMAGALATKFLRELGAEVFRAPPSGRDPFFDVYPAYAAWRDGVALIEPQEVELVLARTDVFITGGEDYPGYPLRRDAAELLARHPRLIVLDISGAPPAAERQSLQAVDILAQARSGLVWELREGKPAVNAFQPSQYGAMFQGLIGVAAALREREFSGRGQIVSVTLLEGVLTWAQSVWMLAEEPTPAFLFETPKAARPIILRCRDGAYIHIVLGALGSKAKLYEVLGIQDPAVAPDDAGRPNLRDPPEKFFGDVELLQSYAGKRDSTELLRALWAVGQVAEPILPPGACWDDPQVIANGLIARTADGVEHVGNPATFVTTGAARELPAPTGPEPFAGVTVIDFGAYVAGPMASSPLATLGAEVIKVEPLDGDALRVLPRFFLAVNHGKRSIALDMKAPEGLEIAQRLCARADVVCSNFRIGVAARFGLDAASLHAARPELLVLNNTGYGAKGPKAKNSAFDPAMQAAAGHEIRAGGIGNPPFLNRCAMVDLAGGLLGALSTALALYHRARSGEGVDITVPLYSAAVFLLSELVRTPDGQFAGAEPLNSEKAGYHPCERLYATSDGWIALAARDDRSAARLAGILNVADCVNAKRASWGEAEAQALAQAIGALSTKNAVAQLRAASIWVEPCVENGQASALHDPALQENGTVYRFQHPEYGETRGLGPLFSLSRSARRVRGLAPAKGEHTREILRELGYAEDTIASLFERRIVL